MAYKRNFLLPKKIEIDKEIAAGIYIYALRIWKTFVVERM